MIALLTGLAARRILMAVTFTAVGYFGISKIISTVKDASLYESKSQEVVKLNQDLAEQAVEHKEEVRRLADDRQKIEDQKKSILKRAQIEGGKYRKLKEAMKDVENWDNLPVPDSVQRLRLERYRDSLHSKQDSADHSG